MTFHITAWTIKLHLGMHWAQSWGLSGALTVQKECGRQHETDRFHRQQDKCWCLDAKTEHFCLKRGALWGCFLSGSTRLSSWWNVFCSSKTTADKCPGSLSYNIHISVTKLQKFIAYYFCTAVIFSFLFFSFSQLYNLHNYVLENSESGNHRGSEVERRKSFKFTDRLRGCETDEKVLMP